MKLIIVLTIVFATAAFASQQPAPATSQSPDPPQQEQKATNPIVTATKANIYVYRLRLLGGMLNKPSVYVDEKEIARIANGRFFIVNVDPGQHVIRSGIKPAAVTLDMNPGQVYYIRVDFEPAQYFPGAATILIPPEQGWSEIGQTEPSDAKEIKDHDIATVGAKPPKPASVPSPAGDPSAPGTCRSIAVTRVQTILPVSDGYKVIDVVNYPGVYVGKWYEVNSLPTARKDGVQILVLTKGYTPEDVARAHGFCQLEASGAEPKEMVEGTLADAQLQADIANMIRTLEAADHPNCEFQIAKQLHTAGKPGEERWDVKSCNATISYDVRIVPSPKGGSDFRAVKSPVQEINKDTASQPPVSSQPATADTSPEELVPYEGQKNQFTISLPSGWVGQDQSQTPGMNGNPRFNLILFHPPYPNLTDQDAKSVELMAMKLLTGIDSGEISSFFVQRVPAKNGMSCAGLSEKGEKDVFKMITGDPILGKGAAILEAPRSEPISVAGCKGIRIRGTGQPAKENAPQTLDVYAVSDGNVLYLFTLRNHADNYKRNVDIFEKSVATARLTAPK